MPVKISGHLNIWLNYHHLYYFYIIATAGTVAKAAQIIGLGQPSLSTQLKQLEDSIGKPLFDRVNKRLVLNENGRIVLEYAEEVFKLGNQMVQTLNDHQANNRIHVQIGALDSVPKNIVTDLVLEHYRLGNCHVTILEGSGEQLLKDLADHKIDLIITNNPLKGVNDIYSRSVGKLEVIMCAAPSFKKLISHYPISLDDQPFILPTSESKLWADVKNFFKHNKIKADIIAETQDTAIQKLLGVEGKGIIPIASLVVEELIKEKKLLKLGDMPGVYEEIWLISADRKIENPISSKVMKTFKIK